jgi:Fic family protein
MSVFDRNTPYNDLPPLPPAIDIETVNVMRKTISAGRSLAGLNGALLSLPNPTLFLDTIHLQEAKASSQVENIITTNDDIYKSLITDRDPEDAGAKEVFNYKQALWIGLGELKDKPFITTNLCIKIAQCINRNTASIRSIVGTTLKNSQNETIYTPPSGEDIIRNKLADLEQFINGDNPLDPLIKMAMMHYQFEAIHPFADGNGRTGRILLLLYLKLSDLLTIPAIFMSNYILKNRTQYYISLQAVTEKKDWENYILYMLDMVEETANEAVKRLHKIIYAMDFTSEKIKQKLPKVYSNELIETMFRLPYLKRQNLIDIKIGSPKTVGNYLISLEKEGFLRSIKVGKEKLYINDLLLNILEDN